MKKAGFSVSALVGVLVLLQITVGLDNLNIFHAWGNLVSSLTR